MKPTTFDEEYQKLNKEQKRAVDTLDGPVMVVAGPGTGKTQTLAMRIANILKRTDQDPSSILALTFTEAGAKAMKSRLKGLIGKASYYINITTFHGFCAEVIRENPDLFPISPSQDPISALRQNKLIEGILSNTNLKLLRPLGNPGFYIQSIIKALSDLKREGYTPTSFADLISKNTLALEVEGEELSSGAKFLAQKNLQKNNELAAIFTEYESTLRHLGDYDFDDMVGYVAAAFANNQDLLLAYQERYQYFLVDEYQDTNTVQNNVVDSLVSFWGANGNIFVVGDPDQCIMRFQGASMENILGFQQRYRSAKLITLDVNYRSAQIILDAAHELITNNHNPISTHLTSSYSRPGNLLHTTFATGAQELSYIVTAIKDLLRSGVTEGDIAVIYRHNYEAELIGTALDSAGVGHRIQGGGNILEDSWVKQLCKLLSLVVKLRTNQDDLDLFTTLHYPYIGVDPLDVMKLSRYSSSNKLKIWEVIVDDSLLQAADIKNLLPLQTFRSSLLRWQSVDALHTTYELLTTIFIDSGLRNHILQQQDSHLILARLNAFFAEVKNINQDNKALTAAGLLADLALMNSQHLKIKDVSKEEAVGAVTLTTAHSAKGLEWQHVFIYKCIDGVWGNNRNVRLITLPANILLHQNLAGISKNEDERRLLYVALTRAQKNCTITSSATYRQGVTLKEAIPSMFLSEMGSVLEKGTVPDRNVWVQPKQGSSADEGTVSNVKDDESLFLSLIIKDLRLSPTSLNTYLECKYKFKLNNLLRVPRAQPPYLSLGTAVHKALEGMYTSLDVGDAIPSLDSVLEIFDKTLAHEIISTQDLPGFRSKGRQMLSAYYHHYKDNITKALWVEKFFGYGKNKIILDGDIELAGKVDRIDALSSEPRSVRVVDYKTGKPKTKGQVEGKTKDSDGAYYRQLVFYKMLLDLDKTFHYDMTEAQLDFIEPDEKGVFRRYNFTITKDDVEALKDTIRAVMQSIRAHDFVRTTNHKTCASCDFVDHCFPHGFPQ